jgi:hypothetical protein
MMRPSEYCWSIKRVLDCIVMGAWGGTRECQRLNRVVLQITDIR